MKNVAKWGFPYFALFHKYYLEYKLRGIRRVQKLKGSMSGDARNFNNIETRAVINFFYARQGAEGNSRYSDRNIRGTCTIVCHRQKLRGQV